MNISGLTVRLFICEWSSISKEGSPVLLYHYLLYSLEIESLSETGKSQLPSRCQDLLCLPSDSAEIQAWMVPCKFPLSAFSQYKCVSMNGFIWMLRIWTLFLMILQQELFSTESSLQVTWPVIICDLFEKHYKCMILIYLSWHIRHKIISLEILEIFTS